MKAHDLAKLLEKGAATGALEKARDVLVRLLGARFGNVDAAAQSRIAKANLRGARPLVERVIVAERIEDVFKNTLRRPRGRSWQ